MAGRVSAALSLALAATAFAAFSPAPGSALGLTGQSLSAVYYHPDTSSPYGGATFAPGSFTVGAGEETVGNVEDVTWLHVDFEDDVLTITFETVLSSPTWNASAFNGIIFTAAGAHGIESTSVNGATTMVGFDDSRVSFSGTELLVNWSGLGYVNGTVVKIDLGFGGEVPEPGTALLLSGGLLGLALRRRARASL